MSQFLCLLLCFSLCVLFVFLSFFLSFLSPPSLFVAFTYFSSSCFFRLLHSLLFSFSSSSKFIVFFLMLSPPLCFILCVCDFSFFVRLFLFGFSSCWPSLFSALISLLLVPSSAPVSLLPLLFPLLCRHLLLLVPFFTYSLSFLLLQKCCCSSIPLSLASPPPPHTHIHPRPCLVHWC